MVSSPHRERGAGFGAILLLFCVALWSLNGPLIKLLHSNGGGVSGITIAFYRSLIGGILFFPFALRHRAGIERAHLPWIAGSVIAFTVMTASFVIATTRTAAANAILLQNTAPIWVFLLSPLLLSERIQLVEGVGLLLAMVGVSLLFLGAPGGETNGLAMALISGFGFGLLTLLLRRLRHLHPTTVVCMNCIGSSALLAGSVLAGGSFAVTTGQFGLLLVLGVVQFSLPYAIFSWSLRHIQAHRASLILLLETVLNPIWTYLAVGEAIPRATLFGGPLILLGVMGSIMSATGSARTRRS